MEYTVTKKVEIHLTLNQEEAEWLLGVVQNYPGDPKDELPTHGSMRRELFETLKDALR